MQRTAPIIGVVFPRSFEVYHANYIEIHKLCIIPYKRKFSRVPNFAILWSKVVSLFSRVQFFANLKIHKMLIHKTGDMTFQGCVGRRQSYSCIPVISVSIDLPVHMLIPRLINFL